MQNRITIDPLHLKKSKEKNFFAQFIRLQLEQQVYLLRENEVYPVIALSKKTNISQKTNVTLSYSLIWTKCHDSNAYHLEVFSLNKERIDSTKRSEILKGYGKLSPQPNGSFNFKPSDDVVKYQHHFAPSKMVTTESPIKIQSQVPLKNFSIPKDHEARLDCLAREVKFSKKAGHRIQSPTLLRVNEFAVESFTVMERHQGEELYSVVYNDWTGKKFLSLDLRIKLSIALLRALKDFHKQRIVHRDIKLENIIVDIDYAKDEMKGVKIFDCEMGKDFDEDERSNCGSVDYVSPEVVLQQNVDQCADVFSLGKTLGFLWRAQMDKPSNKLLDALRDPKQSGYVFENIFEGILELDSHQKKEILSAFEGMTKYDKKKRWTVDQALEPLEKIQCERKINRCADKKHFFLVAQADQRAVEMRKKLDQIEQQYQGRDISIFAPIFKSIQHVFRLSDQLVDHPLAIEQFVDRLGIQALSGMRSKGEIHYKITSLFSSLSFSIDFIMDTVHSITNRFNKEEKEKFKKEIESFFYDTEKMSTRFRESLNVDQLSLLNEKLIKMIQKHKPFTTVLENLIENKNIKKNLLNALHLETKTSKTGFFSTYQSKRKSTPVSHLAISRQFLSKR